eukprot:TRINITY_DN7920_c0_g1_i1.p1 TRINITY_DN7920_c0_g1~~TRINITY_DN7920_c0_g1_i1.p1  ORF type:complete len:693 (-),score=209.97 TRINITY_DN7920_c0_g1_i1:70-2148(-)
MTQSPAQVLASLGSQTYPVPDLSLLDKAERAFKWTLEIDVTLKPKWTSSLVLVQIEEKPFAKGSCRSAHKLRVLTFSDEFEYVAKFSTKKAVRDQYFMDVLMQTFCSKWSELYNSYNPPKKITFLPSFVLELVDRPDRPVCGGEPFIAGEYLKFNNNSGYVNTDASRNTPQAFSHFSLVHSNQELVIIDIQGVNDFYTDPQIHTKSGKGFGEGNLGSNGIFQFIKSHQCNPLCNFLKLDPMNPQSKRMLLRGTLPVVQLALDLESGSAIISELDNKPQRPARTGAAAPDRLGSSSPGSDSPTVHRVQHPLQPVLADQHAASPPPGLRREESWAAAQTPTPHNHPATLNNSPVPLDNEIQHPLRPRSSSTVTMEGEISAPGTPKHTPSSAPATLHHAPTSTTPVSTVTSSEPVWDLKEFKLIETIRGTQAEAMVADERNIYTGSSDGCIAVWDPVEMKHLSVFEEGHSKSIKSLVIKNQALFSAGADGAIKEWDITTQKLTSECKDKGEINWIAVENDSIYTASTDKTVKIWDARSNKLTATLTSHTRAVKCLYVRGNYLFSGSNDQQILVWSLQTNTVLTNLQGHEGWIKSLTGSGNILYSGSHDETIRVWDLSSLQPKHILQTKDKVEALLVTPQALFSASGDYLEIWDPSKEYTLASSTNSRTSILSLSRHRSRIFLGSIGNHLKVWGCE